MQPDPSSPEHSGVGLSDPHVASKRRHMLDVMNALHLTGVQVDVDLPVIAVIGSQSAGKSSLIESISGITLPRASGTCTRCPTECRLSQSTDPWQCIVFLHTVADSQGKPLGQPRTEQFGEVIFDKGEVEDRIRRAQRAILNPHCEPAVFLEDAEKDLPSSERELTFSRNSVLLQIRGPDVQDLSFCDLPGLIANVGTNGNEGDIDLIRDLVTSYISRPSCINLLTVACETDFQNQGAHRLVKHHDPEGSRTIGVLTKPDRIPSGEEGQWLKYIRNQEEPLEHGWFSVKQPDSRAIAAGITWSEARSREREFFSNNKPWNQLALGDQNRLGTENLVRRLSDVLSECISQRLPAIQEELQKSLTATEERLTQLPKPPSTDPLSEILYHISTFSKLLGKYLEGTPKADGLMQSLRPACLAFREAIRETEPDFRPYTRRFAARYPDRDEFIPASFLGNEGKPHIPEDNSDAIYIDDVMARAREAITRELPDHYPFIVIREYITTIIGGWKTPAEILFREMYAILRKHVGQLVSQHFVQYPALQSRVLSIVTEFLLSASEKTLSRIQWFIDLETNPRTLNEPYYADFRDRFLSHYKGWRPKEEHAQTSFVSKIIEAMNTNNDMSTRSAVTQVMAGLAALSLDSLKPTDLAKMLPPDPFDPAIDIMASVRAYFQVAYKRFTDNVPMAIDHELVLSLDRDQALEKAIRHGLGIGGADFVTQCGELIREPRNIADRREELLKKRERLDTARKQLMEAWL